MSVCFFSSNKLFYLQQNATKCTTDLKLKISLWRMNFRKQPKIWFNQNWVLLITYLSCQFPPDSVSQNTLQHTIRIYEDYNTPNLSYSLLLDFSWFTPRLYYSHSSFIFKSTCMYPHWELFVQCFSPVDNKPAVVILLNFPSCHCFPVAWIHFLSLYHDLDLNPPWSLTASDSSAFPALISLLW